jgi:hypothetical protein
MKSYGAEKEYIQLFLTLVLEGFCLSTVRPGYFVSWRKILQAQLFRVEVRIIKLYNGFFIY